MTSRLGALGSALDVGGIVGTPAAGEAGCAPGVAEGEAAGGAPELGKAGADAGIDAGDGDGNEAAGGAPTPAVDIYPSYLGANVPPQSKFNSDNDNSFILCALLRES